MLRTAVITAISAASLLTVHHPGAARVPSDVRFDPAAYFDGRQQAALRGGRPVAAIIRSSRNEVALAAAVRTSANPARLIAWGRRIELMHAGPFVPVSGRFSSQPRIDDIAPLTFPADDLDELRECRPGSCGVKLAAAEMEAIRTAINTGGNDWRRSATEAYRRVLLARAAAFQSRGFAGLLPYLDHRQGVSPAAEFAGIAAGPEQRIVSPFSLQEYFREYPRNSGAVESFLSWAKNVASGAREVVSITHVMLLPERNGSGAAMIATQVYASHYLDASVSYTTLAKVQGETYLVYLRRARVDVIHGLFGGFIRGAIERRVRADAPRLLDEVRRRLEGGDPQGRL